MTERSLPHQDGVGDGGPYSASQWHMLLETVGLAVGANVGVVPGILNELAVTSTGDNNITVNTGRALVEGVVYENDASESKTTSDPGGAATTGRRAVLRLDVAARTVRIAIITSADDVTTLPTLTQSAGVTWEIPLASFQIAPSGAITALTDEREYTVSAIAAGRFVSRAGQTRWSIPGWMFKVSNTVGQLNPTDSIHFTPILIQETRTFDRIGGWVQELAAGENTRVGIYNARLDPDGLVPTTLIVDGGQLSVNAQGVAVEAVISEELTPGFYFLAQVNESVTPRFRAPDTATAITVPVTALSFSAGQDAISVLLKTDTNPGADWVNNGLPATAPAVTAMDSSSQACLQLRDSS